MIRVIVAFLASIFTAVQIVLIYTNGKGICFNNGCEIVDNLTTVSPFFFNIVGFFFFQTIFWCFFLGRNGSEYWYKLARLLLLAGLATEGVLVYYQYSVAAVFCSYCLVVFALILLLNILSGLRQIFNGAVLFFAVIITCFSLQFSAAKGSGGSLDAGSIALVKGEREDPKLYLFFSSTCSHCEQVIDTLRQENICTVGFNPVERIDTFFFPASEVYEGYDPTVNLNFMKSLSINEVPVLVAREEQGSQVLKGEVVIREYLDENCRNSRVEDYSGRTSLPPFGYEFLVPSAKVKNDGCVLATDCEDDSPGEAAGSTN